MKNKEDLYKSLLPQIESLIEPEKDFIANLANICAVLKERLGFFWVGFYLTKQEELVLGPFQGPLACTRIKIGQGVCGKSAQNKETFIVDDVHKFDGHIACNANSKSEIVIPLIDAEKTKLILDCDSDVLNNFDELDQKYLEKLIAIIKKKHFIKLEKQQK